jgi:LmbE family N-acetylglucosaminyl deacetylase
VVGSPPRSRFAPEPRQLSREPLLWLLIVPGVILVVWVSAILATTDPKVPSGNVKAFKNVLAVFPHADDETVNCGGTIHRFAAAGAATTLLLLTGGERGNPAGIVDESLQTKRMAEAERVARILGVSRLIQEDFGDGLLSQNRVVVTTYLEQMIRLIGPDLLLTYDQAGLDGHPDHVACAEILLELKRTQFPGTALWCTALPNRVVGLLKLARQLRVEPALVQRRASPTWRIFIGSGMIPKIRAWYSYRSQRRFIAKGLGRVVPAWFAVSAMPFEYFAEVR